MTTERNIAIAAGGIGVAALLIYLLRQRVEEPPPPPPEKGTLYGRVRDATTNQAIVGQWVYIDGHRSESPTDSDGNFSVVLDPGWYYELVVDGYHPYAL